MADSDNPFDNNLFSNHFLKERIDELEEWQEAELEDRYLAFVKLYENNQRLLSNNPKESRTWSNFTSKIFKKILGHYSPQDEPSKFVSGTEYNPDYTLFKDKEEFLDAQEEDKEFETCYAIIENKRWDRTLDKSTQDHNNPAFQTYNYVDRLRVPWGILTNGKKWRLYSYEDCEADTFFQIDVVEQIIKEDDREKALRNFKYFYLFFSTEAFLPHRDGFADKVLTGSFNYAESLEEDLEDRIYTALEETSRGFFEYNDIEKTEENVDLVHRSSLILLYRLLFVLNAESRQLLPVNEGLYRNKLSLAHFREHLREEDEGVFDEYDWAWDRLTRLFKAIDSGKQYGDYKITAYNGGLFRYPENADEDEEVDDENKFLSDHKLRGTKLKEILKLLAVSKNEEDEEVLVDYKDLNIRHLGSVYEGLLEHELKIAEEDLVLEDSEWVAAAESSKNFSEAESTVKEGQAYITNESGERKATGSYYTPEYIVEHIVENTVKPKVENKIEEAEDKKEVLDKVLELNICDPAMGSGHFLTEATSFIAHKIAEKAELNGQVDDDNEIVWLKRQVVQNSIYGVDINPLAVELGKLSLWIETMSEGKPLSFLDHHLKVGNSLIGTSIEELEHHPGIKDRPEADFEEIFGVQNARDALHLEYKKIEDMSEETKEDVHEKEQAYKKFREENFYYKFLKKLSNVHTYLTFEEELSPKEYNQIRNEVMDIDQHEGESWYESAQRDATNRNYFHWELEFPKVFFSTSSGFDAVIGNPPYARIQSLKKNFPEAAKYYEKKYNSSTQNFDIYANFTEKGYNLLDREGLLGYIEPHKFFQARFGKGLREFISDRKAIYEITSFEHHQVFEEASVYTCILILSKTEQEEFRYAETDPENVREKKEIEYHALNADYKENSWNFNDPLTDSVLSKIDEAELNLESIQRKIFQGIATSADKIYLVEIEEEVSDSEVKVKTRKDGEQKILEKEVLKPILKGKDVHRYDPLTPRYSVIYPYKGEENPELIEEKEMENKYPKTYSYLKEHEKELRKRDSGSMDNERWFDFTRPQNLEEYHRNKIITPEISNKGNFTYDEDGMLHNTKVYSIVLEEDVEISEKYLLAVLNNPTLWFFLSNTGYVLRGGYFTFKTDYLNPFSVPDIQFEMNETRRKKEVEELQKGFGDYIDGGEQPDTDRKNEVLHDFLGFLSEQMIDLNADLDKINLNVRDYLGNYSDGETLGELYTQRAPGSNNESVSDTAADKEKLQVGTVETRREGNDVSIMVSARFKPENKNIYETDRYGYTETDLIPTLQFHNLTELQATLIEEFVPVAVEEAGGFADFRSSATKTMSLIDRMKKLTLPEPSDIEKGLQKFIDQRNKADELQRKIDRTDELIDEIVYDLYDLTEEEIDTVEASI